MQRISRSVRTITGIALASALCAPAAAEEKSSKPRIAVIEFKDRSHGQFEIESSQWGEWIADVERPRDLGSWSKAQGLDVNWDAPQSRGSTGANEKITIHGGRTESRGSGGANQMSMDDTAGKEKKAAPAAISHDLRTNVIARTAPVSGGDPDRPIIAGQVPNASAASVGAAQSLTVGGGRTESASAALGRGLDIASVDGEIVPSSAPSAKATRIRTFAAPLPRGSVTLRLKQPWAGCAAGARFDGVFVMTSATHGYRLGGAEVARCDGRAVTINYTMFAPEGTPTD